MTSCCLLAQHRRRVFTSGRKQFHRHPVCAEPIDDAGAVEAVFAGLVGWHVDAKWIGVGCAKAALALHHGSPERYQAKHPRRRRDCRNVVEVQLEVIEVGCIDAALAATLRCAMALLPSQPPEKFAPCKHVVTRGSRFGQRVRLMTL